MTSDEGAVRTKAGELLVTELDSQLRTMTNKDVNDDWSELRTAVEASQELQDFFSYLLRNLHPILVSSCLDIGVDPRSLDAMPKLCRALSILYGYGGSETKGTASWTMKKANSPLSLGFLLDGMAVLLRPLHEGIEDETEDDAKMVERLINIASGSATGTIGPRIACKLEIFALSLKIEQAVDVSGTAELKQLVKSLLEKRKLRIRVLESTLKSTRELETEFAKRKQKAEEEDQRDESEWLEFEKARERRWERRMTRICVSACASDVAMRPHDRLPSTSSELQSNCRTSSIKNPRSSS